MGSNGEYDLRPQEHPIVDKHLRFDQFQSFDCGMFHLVWIYHGCPGKTSSCTSSSTGWLPLRKKCPHVLGSVSSNSHNSMFPTSRIICFDSGLKGLNDWLCRRSCWRACRFGWFSIFWICCRTLVLCACFTTECGSPGILKSTSASFIIIGSWSSSWTTMDSSILLRSTSSSTLSVLASWHTWESSCAAAVWRVATSRPVLSWVCSTLRLLLSSDERVWFTSVSTGRPVLSEELSSSLKELTLISWERDVFLPSFMLSSRPDLSRIGFGVGWVDWKNVACLATSPSGCRTTSPLVVEQLSNPILLSIRASRRSLAEVEVTCLLFRIRLLQFSVWQLLEYNKLEVFLGLEHVHNTQKSCVHTKFTQSILLW